MYAIPKVVPSMLHKEGFSKMWEGVSIVALFPLLHLDKVYTLYQKTATDLTRDPRTNKTNMAQAVNTIWSMYTFYKGPDTSCLKPDENVDPAIWESYAPELVKATTKKDMAEVRTFPYDKRFQLFDDRGTLEDDRRWLQTELFKELQVRLVSKSTEEKDSLPCAIARMKAEYGSYAKQCKKRREFQML